VPVLHRQCYLPNREAPAATRRSTATRAVGAGSIPLCNALSTDGDACSKREHCGNVRHDRDNVRHDRDNVGRHPDWLVRRRPHLLTRPTLHTTRPRLHAPSLEMTSTSGTSPCVAWR
jgi:hypothetical protein